MTLLFGLCLWSNGQNTLKTQDNTGYNEFDEPGNYRDGAGNSLSWGGRDTTSHKDGKPIPIGIFQWVIDPRLGTVIPAENNDTIVHNYQNNNLYFPHTIVAGGMTRFHSVRAALEEIPDGAVVAVHDGVRPIVPDELLMELLTHPLDEKCAGVIPVISVVESMRKKEFSEDGVQTGSHPVVRENYVLVQTPQVFDSTRLKQAYKKPYSPAFTDDATVMESSGYSFDMIEGSKFNLKITTRDDLEFARRLFPEI